MPDLTLDEFRDLTLEESKKLKEEENNLFDDSFKFNGPFEFDGPAIREVSYQSIREYLQEFETPYESRLKRGVGNVWRQVSILYNDII